jgi:hypothetical protein
MIIFCFKIAGQTQSGRPKIQRTNSLVTTLAMTPQLQNASDLVRLLEGEQQEQVNNNNLSVSD